MICYFDENKLARILGGTPKALRSRALADAEANLIERGITFPSTGPGYVVADISRAKFTDVVAWLEEWMACVNIQRGDVISILGRDIDGLVLVRAFDVHPEQTTKKLSSLTPGEIVDACRNYAWELQAESNQLPENESMYHPQAEQDLINAGIIPKDSGRSLDPTPSIEQEFHSRIYGDEESVVDYLDPFQFDGRF